MIIIMIMMVSSSEDYYYFNNNNNNNININNNISTSFENDGDGNIWLDETTDYNPSSSASSEIINNNHNNDAAAADDDYYNEQKTTIDFYKRLCSSIPPEHQQLTTEVGLDWNQTIELCQNFYNGTWPTLTTINNNATINQQLDNPEYELDDNYNIDDDGYLNPNLRITLIVLLSLMIVCTIIGNILVCLSVILVRKLRHPSNYLLVSLAISDLCVAILVMPLALHSELSHTWQLSNAICDLWVSFDVTCCTSSILNLCTISIDRYLAITKPLTYGVRRTTRRILSFIVCVWVASCLISIPPVLILGNEHGSESQPRCEVSQNLGYQLYATLGAFYIPLLVMIVMYYKIYMAAKRVVDAELRDQRPSSTSMAFRAQRSITNRFYSIKKNSRDEQIQPQQPPPPTPQRNNQKYPPIRLDKNRNYWDKSKATPDELEELNKTGNRKRNKKRSKTNRSSSSTSTTKSRGKSIGKICHYCCCCCCSGGSGGGQKCGMDRLDLHQQQSKNAQQIGDDHDHDHDHDHHDRLDQNLQPKTSTASLMVNSTTDGLTTTCSVVTTTTSISVTPPPAIGHKHLNGHQKLLTAQTSNTSNLSSSIGSNPNDNGADHHHHLHPQSQPKQQQQHFGFIKKYHRSISGGTTTSTSGIGGGGNVVPGSGPGSGSANIMDNISSTSQTLAKQRASNALRERKASVTLGIIMSAFTVCWLPFFILALLRPFSASVMDIPRYVNSIALWLGYANSMLNPIIYVTFHQDFRRAFKYLLCLQCRSMGSKLRAEAYLSQYGNKKFNPTHQNNNGNNNNNNNNNNNIDNHSRQPQLQHLPTASTTTTMTAAEATKMVKLNHPDSNEHQQQQRLLNPDSSGPIASSSIMIHDGTITYSHDDDDDDVGGGDDSTMSQEPAETTTEEETEKKNKKKKNNNKSLAATNFSNVNQKNENLSPPGERIVNFTTTIPAYNTNNNNSVIEGVFVSATTVTNTTTTTNAIMNNNNNNSSNNG